MGRPDVRKTGLKVIVPLLALAGCAEQGGGCHIATLGALPVLNKSGSPIVGVTLNGQNAAMIVDSGADISMVSEAASKQFDLIATGAVVPITGVTGELMAPVMRADKLRLGSASTEEIFLTETTRSFGGSIEGRPIIGLFGADFLQAYDVVFDLPAHTISLFQVHGCSSPTPTWEGKTSKFEVSRVGQGGRISTTLRLNDQKIDAIVDSGAWHTTILPRQARKAGVSKDMLAQDIHIDSSGVNGSHRKGSLHRFASIQVGDERFLKPVLAVSPMETDGYALLGADFLRRNRVWISYRNEEAYVQRLAPPEQDQTFQVRIRYRKVPAGGSGSGTPAQVPSPGVPFTGQPQSAGAPASAAPAPGAPVPSLPVSNVPAGGLPVSGGSASGVSVPGASPAASEAGPAGQVSTP